MSLQRVRHEPVRAHRGRQHPAGRPRRSGSSSRIPITVANRFNEGDVSPLVRNLAEVLPRVRRLLKYL